MSRPAAKPATARPAHPEPVGASREELLALHAEARRKRNAAALGSEAWVEASEEVGRIEIAIARLERGMQPPRV